MWIRSLCFELKCCLCIGLGLPPKPELPSTCSHSKPGVRVTWSAKETSLKMPSMPCAPTHRGLCTAGLKEKGEFWSFPPGGWKPHRAVDQFTISPLALGSKAHIALLLSVLLRSFSIACVCEDGAGPGLELADRMVKPGRSSPCSVSIPKGRVWKQSQQRAAFIPTWTAVPQCLDRVGQSWAEWGWGKVNFDF